MARLESIVEAYIRDHRDEASRELRWFEIQKNVEQAISIAALAQGPKGKRLAHQRRLSRHVLSAARRRLLAQIGSLRKATSFESLHEIVRRAVEPIRGVGELYVYDTALRIGAKLGLSPNLVDLHAGTRVGARRVGIWPLRDRVSVAELPEELHGLEPREIEDLLCIYKEEIAGSALRPREGCFA